MTTKFSVGMPTFNDYDGVYFTTQALKVYHEKWIGEIIVVDNNPKQGQRTERYCRSIGAKYISFGETVGPAGAKDRVIREASFENAVCIDSHVLLHPGFFESLAEAMTLGPHIYHGPLMYDWDHLCGDHMNDVWSGEMWGQWGQAWERDDVKPFALWQGVPTDLATRQPITLPDGPPILELTRRGYRRPEKPFEIPAHGCGFFAVHRSQWLGFNPEFRGFGGEEWYIQTKYRQAGRKAICVPGCQWRHRFNDLSGKTPEYPLTRFNKVRNYCIGHKELGLPLEPIRQHFTGFPKEEWDMACGCSDKKTQEPPPDKMPVEIAAYFEADTRHLVAAETEPLVPTGSVVLGNKPHTLGRWEPHVSRIFVNAADIQVLPFLKARPAWFVVKNVDGWFLLSNRETDRPDLPSTGEIGINAVKALWRAGKQAVQGRVLVDDAVAEKRLELCLVCPERRPGPLGSQCAQCGCFVEKKVWVATEKCPLNKWSYQS